MNRVPLPSSSFTEKPLIVRLRNWVGDVVLGIPLLRLLQSQGYQLHLIGKPWAQPLLRCEGWTVQTLAPSWRARVAQLRQLKRTCQQTDPTFNHRLNALVLPFSFSSALEMRMAGLCSVGYAHEGRGVCLSRSIARETGLHELEAYWKLACPFLPPGRKLPQPPLAIGYVIAPHDELAAQALRLAHRVRPGYLVLCPFAGGTFSKKPKTWPYFGLLAQELIRQGRQVVLCPGPGENEEAPVHYPGCVVLQGVPLGTYAALLKDADMMISNDTGPGHLAAAVGVTTLSVLGPTVAEQWGAWGANVTTIQGSDNSWPSVDEVSAMLHKLSPTAPAGPLHTHHP
jgi:heptosyltransferase II